MGWKEAERTYMGTWVPAEVALGRKDVASMNIVT